MQHQGSLLRALSFLLLGSLLGWQANSIYFDGPNLTSGTDEADGANENLDLNLFWNVKELIETSYVNEEKIDAQKQIYGAITGLVDSLEDPYSVFMTPEETTAFNSSLNGELEGIGAELTVEEGNLLILAPLKDSPAEQAGLLPGDHIYLVNGEPTSEMSLWDAIMAIRGEPGTEVTLTLLREGENEPLEKTIVRQAISIPSVEMEYIDHGGLTIGHISIYQFGDDTYLEFEEAVRQLLLDEPDALIVDVRMNGGGYLDVAVQIMSEFFEDEQNAVLVKYRDRQNEVMKTLGGGRLTTIPLVVLLDEGSASASEILAGALQDYDRATLIGQQSFGKGSVQELDELSDGSTLRLTIAKWYTPLDRSIDDTGISPDVEVSDDENETEEDIQLQAALDYLLNNE